MTSAIQFGTVALKQMKEATGKPVQLKKEKEDNYYRYIPLSRYARKGFVVPDKTPKTKQVFETPIQLTQDQLRALGNRFPNIHFVTIGHESHDHPIAHISAQIAGDILMSKIPPGSRVLDVGGNPKSNEGFNKAQSYKKPHERIVVDTMVCIASSKDAVRAVTKWGPQVVDGKERYRVGMFENLYRNPAEIERLQQYDVVVMHHALYYINPHDLCTMISCMKPGGSVIASMIKTDTDACDGQVIHNGEQKWNRTGRTISGEPEVKQVNVMTGESYCHLSTARWFRNFELGQQRGVCNAKEGRGVDDRYVGMAWTVNLLVPDTYIFTFAGCPVSVMDPDNVSSADQDDVVYYKAPSVTAVSTESVKSEMTSDKFIKIVCLTDGGDKETLVLRNKAYYLKLKAFISMKARNATTLADLARYAKRINGTGELYSGGSEEVPPNELSDYIRAAFLDDIDHETNNLSIINAKYDDMVHHRKLGNVGSLLNANSISNIVGTVLSTAITVTEITESKRPRTSALRALRDAVY